MSKNKLLQNSVLPRRSFTEAGWWIISVLSLIPAVLWIFEAPLGARFYSPASAIRGIGDVTGLCGMAMFSLVMVLSARLKFFEKFFRGINESYTAHHVFGGLTFCLLLFHPLFLAFNYLSVSFNSAALFLLPSTYWPRTFGTAGLLIMIITLAITFYTKLKYQVWKFTHKFLGLAFIFAFFHTFLIGPDVQSNAALKLYLFILGSAGIASYFYRTLFASHMVGVFGYTVKEVKKYEDKIWEITFAPKNRTVVFVPGQFAFVKLHSAGLSKEIHPFSFSSASGNPLKIAIKESGDYTNQIGSLKAGDSAEIEGPFGKFSFRNYGAKQVWIAGGVGVTPFLSMLRGLSKKDSDYQIDFYYSVRDENCLAFKNEMEEIGRRNKNLKLIFWISKQHGFLNGKAIGEKTADLKSRDVLVCGPPVMMSAIKNQLLEMGVEKSRIHAEEFQLY